jgi:hypothetical protein
VVETLPHMNEGSIESWFIALIAAPLALLSWRIFSGWSNKTIPSGPFIIPLGVVLRPQPLFTEKELLLYNLIRLAVQDHYLLFAQVPLWSFLSVDAEGEARTQVLRHLALKRADFILVHPGSRMVEQVVQLEEDQSAYPEEMMRGREVQRVLQAAGIRVTTLKVQLTYTVQQLEQLLGVSDPE